MKKKWVRKTVKICVIEGKTKKSNVWPDLKQDWEEKCEKWLDVWQRMEVESLKRHSLVVAVCWFSVGQLKLRDRQIKL